MLFNASTCVITHETLGQSLTLKVEDVRIHNPNSNIPKLRFKTVGKVTVLFRTDSKVGISIMEYTDMETRRVFDLAVYDHKTSRQVYEELCSSNKIEEATQFLRFTQEWDLVYKLIELLS